MRHLLQPNRWTCLLTSFAMVLETNIDEIVASVGHDGSEVVWPNLPEPECRRSFHIQEMIDFAWEQGYAVTQFQAQPVMRPDPNESLVYVQYTNPQARVRRILQDRRAVLTGLAGGRRHAVAWDGKFILDPNGQVYALDRFVLDIAWLCTKIIP